MIERNPKYAEWAEEPMPGGPANPLGARALYLFQGGKDTYFRIHGTTAPNTIGRSVSNGCIRMFNEDVIDLYERTHIGAPVIAINRRSDAPRFHRPYVSGKLPAYSRKRRLRRSARR